MKVYEWTVSYFDELDDNQEMDIAHIRSKDDPDCIVYALYEHFGWSDRDMDIICPSEGTKNITGLYEFWSIINRDSRGHVMIVTAIKLNEVKHMTLAEFIHNYKTMIMEAQYKANPLDFVKHHDIRCFSFWLAKNFPETSWKETAESIWMGCLPSCKDDKELNRHLEDLYDIWCSDEDNLATVCEDLKKHVDSYFGIK